MQAEDVLWIKPAKTSLNLNLERNDGKWFCENTNGFHATLRW